MMNHLSTSAGIRIIHISTQSYSPDAVQLLVCSAKQFLLFFVQTVAKLVQFCPAGPSSRVDSDLASWMGRSSDVVGEGGSFASWNFRSDREVLPEENCFSHLHSLHGSWSGYRGSSGVSQWWNFLSFLFTLVVVGGSASSTMDEISRRL